jgi:argininosuccinate lyase
MPFRDAHHVTGQIVRLAEGKDVDISQLTLEDMQSVEPRITAEIFGVLTVEASVASRVSYGGTAPANVAAQAKKWLEQLS